MFFKIKALAECGAKIILHCYEYGRKHSSELNKYCEQVHYYPRNISKGNFFSRMPYIVTSRESEELLKRLLQNDYPILMEGLHTTYFLKDDALKDRVKIVRAHNIEHEYYKQLASTEKNLFRRSYYRNASFKLRFYERVLNKAQWIAAISPPDYHHFQKKYQHAFYLPAFHPNEKVLSRTGKGDYALYHGNLEVAENNEAALFLINKVFSKCRHTLLIAGNKPSKELHAASSKYPNVVLKANETPDQILSLIENAHVNILPTFQSTGIKLKLITALFRGRHCIVNQYMVENTGLESLCIIANDEKKMTTALDNCFQAGFSTEEIEVRKQILESVFSNASNAAMLIEKIGNNNQGS